ncbi:ATP-binding protein [Actinokineospora terrae]|uniref:Signal transduction histidine kinase n=1 Tax=Actinokineospora terrae TaxID=155974 RepID=A0A1H9NZY5_9PSEU|nr:ATP-binding protein [Actinokineospora terrae]SER41139.1 Signal transduction histidine kinase [Actinokineospora terrae]
MTEDAQAALDRVVARCAAAMRGATAVLGGVAAIATAGAGLGWVVLAVGVSVVWSAGFAWTVVRRGVRGWVVLVDIALTVVLCLAQPWLVAPELRSGGASWVDGLTSMTIVIAHFAWRPRLAVPAGLVVAAVHVVGAWQVGGALGTLGIHVIQIAATAALMTVLRRSAAVADDALADLRATERAAAVMLARRADEREHKRRLHDTVLATLTTIGTDGVTASSLALRARAAADLAVVEGSIDLGEPDTDVDLRHQLRAVADRAEVAVTADLVPCKVPVLVATAFSAAAAQALANTARHTSADTARLTLTTDCASILVTITDTGPGFDPTTIPHHRYGVREGILGRMRAVDGTATITSTPSGTTITLRWPDTTPCPAGSGT